MKTPHPLGQLLKRSGIPPESEAGRKLAGYLALLEKWNSRINLTASTEWAAIEPMMGEAIWASQFYPPGALSHLDVGSGAGFPAVVLKILHPQTGLDLVESRAKKTAFLETVAQVLGLEGMRAHNARLSEFLSQSGRGRRWDCVSWKGVKLSREDLAQLAAHAHGGTECWIFHGREVALKNPEDAAGSLRLVRKMEIPHRRESHLSIYQCFT